MVINPLRGINPWHAELRKPSSEGAPCFVFKQRSVARLAAIHLVYEVGDKYIYIYIYVYICVYIYVHILYTYIIVTSLRPHCDLTATSLGIMVSKGNHPQMALIQLSDFFKFTHKYIYIYIVWYNIILYNRTLYDQLDMRWVWLKIRNLPKMMALWHGKPPEFGFTRFTQHFETDTSNCKIFYFIPQFHPIFRSGLAVEMPSLCIGIATPCKPQYLLGPGIHHVHIKVAWGRLT